MGVWGVAVVWIRGWDEAVWSEVVCCVVVDVVTALANWQWRLLKLCCSGRPFRGARHNVAVRIVKRVTASRYICADFMKLRTDQNHDSRYRTPSNHAVSAQ